MKWHFPKDSSGRPVRGYWVSGDYSIDPVATIGAGNLYSVQYQDEEIAEVPSLKAAKAKAEEHARLLDRPR
jgi:hypothetical protein